MKQAKTLTPAYAAIQASFWMTWCTSVSFAAVYLQGLGYSNSALGLVTAAGSLLGALLGPALSDRIDRDARVSAVHLTPPVLAAQAAVLLVLLSFPRKGPVTSLGFVLYMMFATSVNSLNLKLYSDAVHRGARLDYGFARGMGSLFFVLVSLLLGVAVERSSVRAVIVTALLLCALQAAAFLVFSRRLPDAPGMQAAEAAQGSPLPAFARKNRRFCVLLLGTMLLFFAHNLVCNFLINITRNVGGDTETMGFLNGFMAAVEIPVMLFFSVLFGRRSSAALLRVAFVFFSLKAVAIALAPSVPLLGAAFLLQAPSFALYASAIVPYVGRAVSYEDSAKAQSLAFTMTTLGGVLANIVGGRLLDSVSVNATLWISCGICVVGTVIALCGVDNKRA